jgi:DnaA initiator-associating protein
MQELVKEIYTESIQAHIAAGEALPSALETAALTIVHSLINVNKVLCCGSNNNTMLASHFTNLLVNFYETERPCLPAIALSNELTHLSNYVDTVATDTFSRQVRAYGNAGDLLIVITITGNEKEVISAVEAALTKDMQVIVLSGNDGGELAGLLGPNDVEVRVPSKRPSRIVESHLFNIHCLSELIDLSLFPQEES